MTNHPVTLVTGAARGIGHAIAIELSLTHRILVGGRGAVWAGELVAELDNVTPFVYDLADKDTVVVTCAGIGRLDVLVHSAGVGRSNDIGFTSRTLWREVFKTNMFAVAGLTRLLLPALRTARGVMMTINSGAGFFSSPGGGVYAKSKFVLRALTNVLHEEMYGKVRVCSIHLGRTDADMQHELQATMSSEHYNGSCYASPGPVAAAVWLAIDVPGNATAERLSIRPSIS